MSNWVAGWNMAAYSPDPDVLYVARDWQDAIVYLTDTVERWWDDAYMGLPAFTEEAAEEIDARYLAIHTALHAANFGEEISEALIGDNGYPWVFFIHATDEEPEDE